MNKLNINEISIVVQGEGKYMGVPHILIRFTGCPLRCQFEESCCDTWYTSWKPEKGNVDLAQIQQVFRNNQQIRHTMITGGEPMMHAEQLKLVVDLAKGFNHHVTIETEGSTYVDTAADFISISPKLRNSTPKPGTVIHDDDAVIMKVTEKHKEQHEKNRCKLSEILKYTQRAKDFQLKFVVSSTTDGSISEMVSIVKSLNIPDSKVYLMPEGLIEEQLKSRRQALIELCITYGYNYTDRLHILAYGTKRGV